MDKILHELVSLIEREDRRFTIGISGHGASGKTTFAHHLLNLLGRDNANYINTDPCIISSHLRKYTLINYEYNNELHQEKMTACHPAAHNIFAYLRKSHEERRIQYELFMHPYHRKFDFVIKNSNENYILEKGCNN
ncbi:hypothetical protein [uncultured Brevibacillus sp.]|uniref:hypothetical protein n=1 Tax=uncultured Brevibacillus sp. TaxID=169970 RepID=UPI002599217A|nr:hypothetical protein [uncultured Brevibacillus sp.]